MSQPPPGILVDDSLTIPDEEVTFVTSRSSGPGGQHVNKVETRVTLRFDLARSAVLTETQKARVREKLPTRINRSGVLWVTAQSQRTQVGNRRLATERFVDLLRQALHEAEPRRPSRVPPGVHRRRLEEKRRVGRTKSLRSRPSREDD